jgi:hypothetical protein
MSLTNKISKDESRLAGNTGTPKEIEDEVRTQLEPLFSDFYAGSKMYKAFWEYLEKLLERTSRSLDFFDVVKLAYKAQAEPKATTALHILLYLTQIELVGTGYVDMVILLLTAKGIDLHLEPDHEHRYTRHATSIKDLDSPSLTLNVKLDFLKMNGLSFFEKCIDRTLRNDIAHANFEIDDNGKFFQLTRKGKKEVDILQKLLRFNSYEGGIDTILNEQMAKVPPPPR